MTHAPCLPDPIHKHLIKIVIHLGREQWAVGSGFVIRYRNKQYLVTAFHNVSGGVSAEARFNHNMPPRPTQVELYYEGQLLLSFLPYASRRSVFLIHPQAKYIGYCDVAVMDLSITISNLSGNALWSDTVGLQLQADASSTQKNAHQLVSDMFMPVGSNVIVYGFPGGRDYKGHPIGVGSKLAACSPEKPLMLLSGYTSSGCSGGLTLARDINGYNQLTDNCTLTRNLTGTPVVDQWLGVYAGRLEGLEAGEESGIIRTHIGVVWRSKTILELIKANCYDSY